MPRDIPTKRTENWSSEDACMWLSAAASLRYNSQWLWNNPSVHHEMWGHSEHGQLEWGVPTKVHAQRRYTGHVPSKYKLTAEGGGWRIWPGECSRHMKTILYESTLHQPCEQYRSQRLSRLAARARGWELGVEGVKVDSLSGVMGNDLEIDNAAGCKHCERDGSHSTELYTQERLNSIFYVICLFTR